MKKLIAILAIMQTIVSAAPAPSPEYRFIQDTYNHVYQHQKLIEFLGLVSNDVLNAIEKECGNISVDTNCTINQELSVTATQAMADASEIYFGSGEGVEVGEIIPLPAGTLTFRKISDSLFQYALTVDTSKIPDSGMTEIFTFSWNDTRDISRVYYTYKINGISYNSSFILLRRNDEGKMIANGYFDDRTNSGEAGTYIMEVRLINPAQHGIIERQNYYDIANDTNVTSKGYIDDNGGEVYIDPYGNDKFDANGISNGDAEMIIPEDPYNGATIAYQTDGTMDTGDYQRFVVVKKNETPDQFNIVGYIFESYDDKKTDNEKVHEYEYFGDEDLLATSNSGSDTDQLDIWALDNENKPVQKVTGVWLEKPAP